MQNRIQQIEALLEAAFHPSTLMVEDDSDAHIGHTGHGGAGHFNLTIVSSVFEGKPLLKRHQMIYDALAALMGSEIHALSIRAKTEGES